MRGIRWKERFSGEGKGRAGEGEGIEANEGKDEGVEVKKTRK